MSIIKQPFERYALDEEKKKRDQITIELDPLQRQKLDRMKLVLDIPSDSVCLKMLFEFGENAMLSSFGFENLEYLAKVSRSRFPHKMHKNLKEAKNAMQQISFEATHSNKTPC